MPAAAQSHYKQFMPNASALDPAVTSAAVPAAGGMVLGLIAGGGSLPEQLAAHCRAAGQTVLVAALTGFTEPAWVEGYTHRWFRLGEAAELVAWLKSAGAGEVCMLGPVRRPSLAELAPTAATAALALKLGYAAALGDDNLLGLLGRHLESEGLALRGAHTLYPALLAAPGPVTRALPDAGAWSDITRAAEVVRALGALDVGQGAVVQQGLVLAVEAIEGTDAMLGRVGALARAGEGGVLVKLRKPQQDPRLDLPTIGPATVEAALAAGLRGIAIEAGGALLAERQALLERADAAGFFITVLEKNWGLKIPHRPWWKRLLRHP
ncbi:LpxI family protein [Radicibacter daui]|uniref:LpxI family protein n=1 Tax=Radicibacter daui TaxID=3064829 RepID=UPI004046C257